MGEQLPDRIVTRSGANIGDLVCVTGTMGDAALGLELLRHGERQGGAVRRHLDPDPRVNLGRALADAAIPTAMIDISDGLAADLGHILRQSGRGARVETALIPLSAEYREKAEHYSSDILALALGGGEEYELLFTLHPSSFEKASRFGDETGVPVTIIGRITADSGLILADPTGERHTATVSGYDHFGRQLAK
jgi:thiamine-monophosphate kinase